MFCTLSGSHYGEAQKAAMKQACGLPSCNSHHAFPGLSSYKLKQKQVQVGLVTSFEARSTMAFGLLCSLRLTGRPAAPAETKLRVHTLEQQLEASQSQVNTPAVQALYARCETVSPHPHL